MPESFLDVYRDKFMEEGPPPYEEAKEAKDSELYNSIVNLLNPLVGKSSKDGRHKLTVLCEKNNIVIIGLFYIVFNSIEVFDILTSKKLGYLWKASLKRLNNDIVCTSKWIDEYPPYYTIDREIPFTIEDLAAGLISAGF